MKHAKTMVRRLRLPALKRLSATCVAIVLATVRFAAAQVPATDTATAAPSRFSIGLEPVAEALQAAGAGQLDRAQIRVEGASASVKNPRIVVEGFRKDAVRNWLEARLRCESPQECLPFYAIVPEPTVPFPEGAISATKTSASVKRPPSPPTVHRGDRAVLFLEGNNLRARLGVVCLNAGARGDRVHVREIGGPRIYSAQVIAPGVVTGKL